MAYRHRGIRVLLNVIHPGIEFTAWLDTQQGADHMTREAKTGEREGLRRIAQKPAMSVPDPCFEFPLSPEQNTDFITPSEKLFVLAHLGVPQIQSDAWSFDLVGLIGAPCSLRYADLARFKPTTVNTILQCAGNPLEPTKPTRLIANVEWRGVFLRDILKQAEVASSVSVRCRHVDFSRAIRRRFFVQSRVGRRDSTAVIHRCD